MDVEGNKAAPLQEAVSKLAHAEEDKRYESRVRHSNPFVKMFYHIMSFVIPGLGMFCEAYFVFSIGNLKPLFVATYPDCWGKHPTVCSTKLSDSLTYTQVSGIICGQLVIGFFADRIGRRLGSILTASFMLFFGIWIAASGPNGNPHEMFLMFTVVQFFFGVGVGGEYPVASSSANERAENTKHLQQRRGETVVCVFSMQGWGNLVNTLVLVILVAAFGQTNPPKNAKGGLVYNTHSLEIIWRLSYAIGLLPLLFIFIYRVWVLRESAVWRGKRQSLKDLGKANINLRSNGLLLRHYWHRIFGTSLSWFVWDFAFYGNKLFQSTFIGIINPAAKSNIMKILEWTLLNSAVALAGYYFAAFTIDKKWMGRVRMQVMGFAWMALLFGLCAGLYHTLLEPSNIHVFQFLYYFSSFWGQFGPNATTWLLPAETVPTENRAQCHGFAAAVGKAGALVAGVIFNLVSDQSKFTISAACGAAGVICTLIFIPDLTGLDLREGDKRWLAMVENVEYTGEAVNPKHLSLLERLMGYGKGYVPSSDPSTPTVTARDFSPKEVASSD